MKQYLMDLFFIVGIIMTFIPIFRFDVDIGFFVLGIAIVMSVLKINKKGVNSD